MTGLFVLIPLRLILLLKATTAALPRVLQEAVVVDFIVPELPQAAGVAVEETKLSLKCICDRF